MALSRGSAAETGPVQYYANVEAATSTDGLLACGQSTDRTDAGLELAAVEEALGHARQEIGESSEAPMRSGGRDARPAGGSDPGRTPALGGAADAPRARSADVQALRHVSRALAPARRGRRARTPPSNGSASASRYGYTRTQQGKYRDAARWCERAIRDAEATQIARRSRGRTWSATSSLSRAA